MLDVMLEIVEGYLLAFTSRVLFIEIGGYLVARGYAINSIDEL